jgi:hypothetical protein
MLAATSCAAAARAVARTRGTRGGAQSTRSSPQGGPSGFEAGKKVKGRKRSPVVDTLGLLLAVSVGAANLQGCDAGLTAVARAAETYPEVATLFVDSAYGRALCPAHRA